MSYSENIEALCNTYKPKALKVLGEIATAARARGFVCEDPFDMSDEEYRWSLLIQEKGADSNSGVDVTLTIAESNVHDGEGDGVNFMLDLTEYGGRIVGGVAPYNFTSDVWVEMVDTDAVARRWGIFMECFSPASVIDRIVEFNERKAA